MRITQKKARGLSQLQICGYFCDGLNDAVVELATCGIAQLCPKPSGAVEHEVLTERLWGVSSPPCGNRRVGLSLRPGFAAYGPREPPDVRADNWFDGLVSNRRCSSVVERILGKAEVVSSNLTSGFP